MSVPVLTIVGCGTGALEALIGARKLLRPDAELCLIAPEREFHYRPVDPDSLFRPVRERSLRIADVAAQAGARLVVDRADVVDEQRRIVLTRDGDTVNFEYLLLAAGGRFRRALRQGELWVRGGDPGFLDDMIAELGAGKIHRVAVVVPRGARWSLPAYELALVLAWSTAQAAGAHVTVITSEEEPLAALGAATSAAVVGELEAAGVEVLAGVEAVDAPADAAHAVGRINAVQLVLVAEGADATDALSGQPTDPARVRLSGGSRVAFDRLISLPTVIGPSIAGVAADAGGFVEVDETLRVRGSERVWAVGACLAATLEHGALAARQADAAVAAIAAEISGTPLVEPLQPGATDLTGILLTGRREQWLAENPVGTREPSTRCLWWPPGRAVGTMLAEQIAARDTSLENDLPSSPDGLVVRAAITLDHAAPATPTVAWGSDEDRRRDIQRRQVLSIARREREAEEQLRELESGLETLAARQQQVIRELRQQGYLRGR
jgi:sulfide:quinone oxidoreductase